VSFILGVIALVLSCLLPIWAAWAVLGGVVTLLHKTARREPIL
jgi:hypothetical protein